VAVLNIRYRLPAFYETYDLTRITKEGIAKRLLVNNLESRPARPDDKMLNGNYSNSVRNRNEIFRFPVFIFSFHQICGKVAVGITGLRTLPARNSRPALEARQNDEFGCCGRAT
jgi:hypothetical protein